MNARWRGPSAGVSPEVALEELTRLYEEKGGVEPEDVVEAATPEDAPLHPAFEWDDGEAAERYRLLKAAWMLRSLVGPRGEVLQVQTVEASDEPDVRCFALVTIEPADDEGEANRVYVPMCVAVRDESMREDVLEQARAELRSFVRKWANLGECVELVKGVRRLLEEDKEDEKDGETSDEE